jgi:glyoxylase-like metal-dependent hydrolase (beta-lactamase superfamily II)
MIIPIMGDLDSNVYLILDERLALIDTGAGLDDRIRREVEVRAKRQVDAIINTHGHYDHCGGNKLFKGAEVHIHRDDAKEMLSGRFYDTYQFFGEELPMKFDRLLQEGDKIELGDTVLEVLHTPGHTYGSICLYDEDEKALFTGDTLFAEGIGRVDLGGDLKMMQHSLARLAGVRVDTLLPGHGKVVEGREKVTEAMEIARELFHG